MTKNLIPHLHSKRFKQKVNNATSLVEQFCQVNGNNFWVSWSGGKDSTTVVHLLRSFTPAVPVVFFNSGLEYPENLTYLRTLVKLWDLNFYEIKVEKTALEIFQKSGVWEHGNSEAGNIRETTLHTELVLKPYLKAVEQFGVINFSGLRTEESAGRKMLLRKKEGIYTPSLRGLDCSVNGFSSLANRKTVCPVWDWEVLDIFSYFHLHNIPQNPVYKKLESLGVPSKDQRVGLFFDGNGLESGRAVYLKNGWGSLWEELKTVLPRIEEWC